jgi:hypothetical protein
MPVGRVVEAMSFCSNCGAKLKDAARFCSGCGAPIPFLPSAPEVHAEVSPTDGGLLRPPLAAETSTLLRTSPPEVAFTDSWRTLGAL